MIYNIDCLEGFEILGKNSVDLIISDPPFGVEYGNNKIYDDSKKSVFKNIPIWFKGMKKTIRDNCHIYIYIPVLEADRWINEFKKVFSFKNLICVPDYGNRTKIRKNNFGFDFQLIIFGAKGQPKRFNNVDWIPSSESWIKDNRNPNPRPFIYVYPSLLLNYRSNVRPNNEIKLLHPNQKNEILIRRLVEISSNVGDTTLDPFCGCGSVPLASLSVNRETEGFEKNIDYFKIAKRRYENKEYFFKQEDKYLMMNNTNSGLSYWLGD